MKTVKLYDEDSHLTEFEATVIDSYPFADGFATILDRTAFFPEGGGQASDIGFIEDAKVFDVQIDDEIIYHYTTKQFKKGAKINGKIDFERRFDFMQQHSGEHIISGVAYKLYGCENVGFHLGEDIVTLDFDKPLKRNEIEKIELLSNKAVYENLNFYTYYPDEKTLETLYYRSKKELEGDIRIVEIENTDVCACCAPHVAFSGEIGIIKLLSCENLRGGVRIEIKCGNRALNDYKAKYENILKISNSLCVKQNEASDAVDRLLKQISELKFQISGLKKSIIAEKVESFKTDKEITASFEDDFDIKELQIFADSLYKTYGGVRAVFSKKEDGFSFVICGEESSLQNLFSRFKAEFSVKGGGRNGMVQGTVFAKGKELELFFGEIL